MRYPELVHKLIVIGTTYNNDGLVPGFLGEIQNDETRRMSRLSIIISERNR